MKKINYLAIVLFSGLWASVYALGIGNDVGVGVRALAFAGNHTAVVNDLSAAYWNPAALGFLPVREFQVNLDGGRTYGASDISGRNISNGRIEDYKDRIRLGSIGVMSAIPTVQGGLTIAAAYENPYTFDDFSFYEFTRQDGSEIRGKHIVYGGLNNWSGSFGVQVAKGLSAGATVSLITGAEHITSSNEDGNWLDESESECKYMGLGLRAGLLYTPAENLRLGFQISAPQNLRFKEEGSDNGKKYRDNGRVYRAISGALGAGAKLPWMTIALDGRFTMPYTFTMPLSEEIPQNSQAKYFKLGGGVGLEIPLVMYPVVYRVGYSYDEYDLFSNVVKYEDDSVDWSQLGYSVDRNRHTASMGVGVFTSGTGLEFSYSYQTWALAYNDGGLQMKQNYSAHRMAVAFIVRY